MEGGIVKSGKRPMRCSKQLRQRAQQNRTRYAIRELTFDVLPKMVASQERMNSILEIQQRTIELQNDTRQLLIVRKEQKFYGSCSACTWDQFQPNENLLRFFFLRHDCGAWTH